MTWPVWANWQAGLAVACIALVVTIILQGLNVELRLKYRHIPGPSPRWLLGNALDLFKPPLDMFVPGWYQTWSAKYGPVFKWFLGLQPIVVVQDAELARLILVKHFSTFHDRWIQLVPVHPLRRLMIGSGILFSRGKYWAGVRAAAAPMFHTEQLHAFSRVMNAAADKLVAALKPAGAAGTAVDVNAILGHVTMGVIGQTAFGVDFATQDVPGDAHQDSSSSLLVLAARQLLAQQSTVLMRSMTFVPPVLRTAMWQLLSIWPTKTLKHMEDVRSRLSMASLTLAKNAAAGAGLEWHDQHGLETLFSGAPGSHEMAALLKDVKPAPGTLIDMLVRSHNRETGERLQPHQIVAQAQVFLLAGYETTLFVLSTALHQLAKHPDIQQWVVQEVDELSAPGKPLAAEDLDKFRLTEAVLNESLRLLPSAPLTTRQALEDITVGDWCLPKGTVVHIDIYGIHRNPQYFPRPLEFRPERFLKGSAEAETRPPHAFLPFGAGPRMCIGWKFAMQEAMITVIKLLQHYTFTLDESQPQPPRLRYGITLGYPDGVHLVPHARSSSNTTTA